MSERVGSGLLPSTTKPCARDLIIGNPKTDHPVVGSDPTLDSTWMARSVAVNLPSTNASNDGHRFPALGGKKRKSRTHESERMPTSRGLEPPRVSAGHCRQQATPRKQLPPAHTLPRSCRRQCDNGGRSRGQYAD